MAGIENALIYSDGHAVAVTDVQTSVITGGGQWVEIKAAADRLFQHLIVTAERKWN